MRWDCLTFSLIMFVFPEARNLLNFSPIINPKKTKAFLDWNYIINKNKQTASCTLVPLVFLLQFCHLCLVCHHSLNTKQPHTSHQRWDKRVPVIGVWRQGGTRTQSHPICIFHPLSLHQNGDYDMSYLFLYFVWASWSPPLPQHDNNQSGKRTSSFLVVVVVGADAQPIHHLPPR